MNERGPEMARDPDLAVEVAAKFVRGCLAELDMIGKEKRLAWIAKVFERVRAGEDRAN